MWESRWLSVMWHSHVAASHDCLLLMAYLIAPVRRQYGAHIDYAGGSTLACDLKHSLCVQTSVRAQIFMQCICSSVSLETRSRLVWYLLWEVFMYSNFDMCVSLSLSVLLSLPVCFSGEWGTLRLHCATQHADQVRPSSAGRLFLLISWMQLDFWLFDEWNWVLPVKPNPKRPLEADKCLFVFCSPSTGPICRI